MTTPDGPPTTYLAMASGGLVSWAAARRVVERHGSASLRLLFADTIIEDEDLYRFLIESSAALTGCNDSDAVAELASRALALPPVESGRMAERKAMLAELRRDAADVIPALTWLADGRTPWEVFRAERMVGNGQQDPCSKILKRQLMDRWRAANCDPATTVLVYGLDWSERGRIEGKKGKPGLRARMAEKGWTTAFPMDERPYLTKGGIAEWAASEGIGPPRLYDLGFSTNNCGGMCVKMGLAQARHLLFTKPDYYRWSEDQERETLAAIGPTAVPFLAVRKGGKRRRITMGQLRGRLEAFPLLYADHGGGCGGGCAVDD